MSASVAAHVASPIKSSEQFSSYLLGSPAALILMKHRELAPYVECHAAQDECFQWLIMKRASHERIVGVLYDQAVDPPAFFRKRWKLRA
ncbi:hypothetical protein HMPREF2902_02680 [Actinomyces sp. HMSC035G02]|nr:hypothetical protein HMPREF2902_02680 [Actinomyces sp. HMSC035G02]